MMSMDKKVLFSADTVMVSRKKAYRRTGELEQLLQTHPTNHDEIKDELTYSRKKKYIYNQNFFI